MWLSVYVYVCVCVCIYIYVHARGLQLHMGLGFIGFSTMTTYSSLLSRLGNPQALTADVQNRTVGNNGGAGGGLLQICIPLWYRQRPK